MGWEFTGSIKCRGDQIKSSPAPFWCFLSKSAFCCQLMMVDELRSAASKIPMEGDSASVTAIGRRVGLIGLDLFRVESSKPVFDAFFFLLGDRFVVLQRYHH